MDKDLLERLAREAGLADFGGWTESNIERFAALVAEQCAKVCENTEWLVEGSYEADGMRCADAIREKFKERAT